MSGLPDSYEQEMRATAMVPGLNIPGPLQTVGNRPVFQPSKLTLACKTGA